jgi:uncharacterized protein (TIGR02677 family)
LRRLVELVAAGVTAPAELRAQADLSPRHLRYYLLATETLGWLETTHAAPAVTSRARRLLATSEGTAAERAEIAASIRDSVVLRRIVGDYLSEPGAGVDELGRRIAASTGLSEATAHRRAICLRAWRTQLEAGPGRPGATASAGVSEPSDTERMFQEEPDVPMRPAIPPAPTPAPSAAPGSSATLGRSETPGVSAMPGSSATPALSATPAPSATPALSATLGPSPTPRPSAAPELPRVVLRPIAAFKYVTEEHAPTYRAIVQVFFAAKQHYAIELRPADVVRELTASGLHAPLSTGDELDYHLGKLVEWGNLSRAHDTATVSTIADFYKKSFVYHLTPVGEAAQRAVLEVEATVGRSGSLQANMLLAIRDDLRLLAALATESPIDPERALRLLHALFTAFDTLTVEAARFIGEISSTFGADRIEEEHFVLRKQALVAYISRFLGELRKLRGEIAACISAVDATRLERLLAAASSSADIPPALGDTDPRVQWMDERRQRWAGVRGWFTVEAGAEPTVERLMRVAVEAILGLTRALGRLHDRRSQPVDRQADYLALARWFSACDTEREAHRLYEAAFGLYGARHFHLADDDPDLARPSESWWTTPPVLVPVSLRTRGTLSRAGRPAPAPDHEAGRAWIAQRQRRERQQLEAAQRRFADKGELRLSDVATLNDVELDVLLALLDEALASPRRADGSRVTRTADGRLTITLRLVRPVAWVELDTPGGRLRCRDHSIEVASSRGAAAEAAS